MDPIYVLLGVGGLLLVYQLFLAKDSDALDRTGHSMHHRRRR